MGLPFQQPDGSASTISQLMARARLLERIGFDGIWFGDSIGRVQTPRPDSLLWLAIAAAATETIEIGTAVLQVPLRHPVELAKRLFTINGLTSGRFTAGLGAGSTRSDFEAVDVNYEDRFRRFSTALPIIRQLCRGEEVNGVRLAPWPDTRNGPADHAWRLGERDLGDTRGEGLRRVDGIWAHHISCAYRKASSAFAMRAESGPWWRPSRST